MRRSDIFFVLLVVSGFVPSAASAQQTVPDANQVPAQTRPEATSPQPDQAQTQNAPVQPDRTPRQSDQARDSDGQAAEDTRLNRDWTTRRQRSEDHMDM